MANDLKTNAITQTTSVSPAESSLASKTKKLNNSIFKESQKNNYQISIKHDKLKQKVIANQNPELAVLEAEKLLKKHPSNANGGNLVISQGRLEGWCANTVNYVYQRAYGKNPFGLEKNGDYKITTVKDLRDWGIKKSLFNKVEDSKHIQKQINEMHPGDIIIWKSPYTVPIEGNKKITRHASHTGIVRFIKNGKLYTIEGNANIIKKNKKGEFLIVKNNKEGINGNQAIGDFQEINSSDAMIEKNYTAKDLANSGYSGYINMQKIKQ